jgi:hypothetical protein
VHRVAIVLDRLVVLALGVVGAAAALERGREVDLLRKACVDDGGAGNDRPVRSGVAVAFLAELRVILGHRWCGDRSGQQPDDNKRFHLSTPVTCLM